MKDESHFNRILDNILIPRVVGTDNHEKVKNFIADEMEKLQWTVEKDEFRDNTPFGELIFTNVIAKLNPNAERYLVLACHYDSKYFEDKNKEFLGATDSAVPCAMLINMASVLSHHLQQRLTNDDLSLMFIFFDGEEAFVQWTATDSIYGSRHLAEKWEKEEFLHRIDMLVLLDLLGSPDPVFYSLMPETLTPYASLSATENRLSEGGLMERYSTSGVTRNNPNKYFQELSIKAGIEDDHIPFMRRNVPILHLIPVPFPTVWHTFEDDREAIDVTTVENLMKVLRTFIVEYLHIDVSK
jgi:glutaminyl-peptide cyclotransferase